MPPLRRICLPLLFLFITAGCGRGTESGKVFVPGQGHPEQWASHLAVGASNFHGTFMKTAPTTSIGGRLFVMHCAPCHGNDGLGKIGPNIRNATVPIINGAIQALPVMRGHTGLSEGEVREIAAYLSTLAVNTEPVTGSFDTTICAPCHGADLDGGIAQVSCFSCHNGPDGGVGHPAGWLSGTDGAVRFHGAYGRNFVSGCGTCHGPELGGGIVLAGPGGFAPGCSSCHNGAVAPLL